MPIVNSRPHSPCLLHRASCAWRAWRAGLLALGLLSGAGAGLAGQPLILHYQERPPYSSTGADGLPQGLLVAPLKRALQATGIAHRWANTPSQRQMALIQNGEGRDCGVGWFYSSVRETLGRFSRPIYRNQPFQALVRIDRAFTAPPTPAALLADATQPLLAKEGYSYGVNLDALIRAHPDAVLRTTAESVSMARMIAAGRAGWMLISPEEGEPLLAAQATELPTLRLLALAGNEPGPTRHLYCNRHVSAEVITRLDRALAER